MYVEIITLIDKYGIEGAFCIAFFFWIKSIQKSHKKDIDNKIEKIIETEHDKTDSIIAVEKEKTALFREQFESEKEDKQKLYENLSKMSDTLDGFINVFKDTYSKLDGRVLNVENKVDNLTDVIEEVLDVKDKK